MNSIWLIQPKKILIFLSKVTKSTKKLTEESTNRSLIDDLSKRLLGLDFRSNNSIKTKCLKYVIKKILLNL